jgi:perosamine synthetase
VKPLPLFDCRLDAEAISAMQPALAAGHLAAGPDISTLETALSARLGGRPVVAVSDSTQAIEIALRCEMVGASPEDEVLTLSYNCMSSNSAIKHVGATPVWVDIDPDTASFDIAHGLQRRSSATRAVIAYHVAGYPANISELRMMCDANNLTLIEDANAAIGASFGDGRPVGSIGDYAVFSFYANRSVNGIEGAALVCPNEEIAHRARALRRFGIDQSRFRDSMGEISPAMDIIDIGLSATMPNAHAALALHQLGHLDQRLAQIRTNVVNIVGAINGTAGIRAVLPSAGSTPAYWVLLLLCEDRDAKLAHLNELGIACSKLHQPNHIYSGFQTGAVELPGTDRFMESVLAVPCGWWMNAQDCERVSQALAR